MNEDEAFLRAIVDNPGDDTARLVYADWLDDRDDPRGTYLRTEFGCVKAPNKRRSRDRKKLRTLASSLDALWVARVSRPPLGVCVEGELFRRAPKPTTEKAIAGLERKYKLTFPVEYRALLLNYNGCGFLYPPMDDEEPDETAFSNIFCGVSWVTGPILHLEEFVESMYEGGDNANRGSELFPIGGPEHERTIYLIGVRGKSLGRVFTHEEPCEVWSGHRYCSEAAKSLGVLLAVLAARTTPY